MGFNSVESAPKNGDLLILLVRGCEHHTEETRDGDANLFRTIGSNSLEHTGEDTWDLAGWDWNHDQFRAGEGQVIGWLPMPDIEVEG